MMGLGAALVAGGLAIAFHLSPLGGICVLVYLLGTLAYSLSLKRKLFVDVIALAALYMMRLVAGGLAVSIALSPWFLSFFMFAFLSLAIVKRQIELRALRGSDRAHGRAWRAADLPVAAALGAASGVASAIVFTLYIQSPEVSLRYDHPEFLWLICPLLIYWLGRMTLLANRGAVDHDPVEFTLKDRTSWLTGVGILAAFAAAI